jgi:hypothetical protein
MSIARTSAREFTHMTNEIEPHAHYVFIVARNRPDILARVQERLRGDVRIEVITDRRYGERRTSVVPCASDRRRADRRRPTRHWDDLSVYPTLVVQKRLASYAEVQQKAIASARESQALREDNDRLCAEIASLQRRLEVLAAQDRELRAENLVLRVEVGNLAGRVEALLSADAALKADAMTILAEAEQGLAALIARFQTLIRGRGTEEQPRRRSA